MEIKVVRQHFNEVCSIGQLSVESDDFTCYTLEDCDRHLSQQDTLEQIKAVKVYGKTCIPYGRYEVVVSYSNKFKKNLPLLLDVKGFEGIRVHSGNTDADTLGCILVGTQKDVTNNRILNSRTAFAELFLLINEKIKTEKVFITIEKVQEVIV